MKKFHLGILNRRQLTIFPRLKFLGKEKFYLAGGTGLSLQLGHRSSIDFDFYSQKHFDPPRFYQKIEAVFPKETEKISQAEDTLFCSVNQVSLSLFQYEYPLVKPLVNIGGVPVASLVDIAAMKMIAVAHRPVKRDYIDVFYLLRAFSLDQMFRFVQKKYSNFNLYYCLRALTYFEDIKEEGKRKIKVFDKSFSWEKAKKKIFEEVKRYQLAMIKK